MVPVKRAACDASVLFQRRDVAVGLVLVADELIRPGAAAALARVIRERVAHVGEALEVVGAREVGAQPVEGSGALALRVGARALEVLRAEVAGRRRGVGALRAAESRHRLAFERAADAGRNRRLTARTRAGDRREGSVIDRGGAVAAGRFLPDVDSAGVRVERPVVSANARVE